MTRYQAVSALFALLITTAAHAAEPERVTLRDGSIVQGELVEKVPGDHITLKLATGEVRQIAWSDVVPEQAAPPPRVQVQQRAPATTHVAVTSTKDDTQLAQVMRQIDVRVVGAYGDTAYGHIEELKIICTAPCEADVDPAGDYKVGGGIHGSSMFNLPPGQNPLKLNVDAGSKGMFMGGLIATLTGAAVIVTGGTIMLLSAVLPQTSFDPVTLQDVPVDRSGMLIGGIITAVAGAALVGLGVPLIVISSTHVTTGTGQELATRPHLTLNGLVF